MGGTSTDVSRYDGHFDHIMETTTAGVTIQSPQLDICTVAAGGGSILFWENGLLRVGPESAGASPGPACYRKGGPLTVTDANVFLGRLVPSLFPHIFGPKQDMPLDVDIVRTKFEALATQINADTGSSKTAEEVAIGFLQVATEAMCTPIRTLSEARGHETAAHHLAVFGGAGGQVACAVAGALGISRVILHKSSAILSAYGIAHADLVEESQEGFAGTTEDYAAFMPRLAALQARSADALALASHDEDAIMVAERYLNMRYAGADATLMIREPEDGDWAKAFKAEHHLQFGFSHGDDRAVCVDDLRVRVVQKSSASRPCELASEVEVALKQALPAKASGAVPVYFDDWEDTKVYDLCQLRSGTIIDGPALIYDKTFTVVVEPKAKAIITPECVVLELTNSTRTAALSTAIDPVQLSVFGHRFMSISEQMGRALQKTAVSVNIKERLDFSCALFDPEGRLVANAPHVPAMLGSMQFAVKWQADYWKGKLKPGDVLLSNHPIAGGVHLPDFTVVTPVFDPAGKEIIFCRSNPTR